MKPEKNKLPIKTALFNQLFGVLPKSYRGMLNSDQLKNQAIRKTGLSDFGDPYFNEGLEILIEDANKSSNLNNLGRVLLKSAIVHNLSNRLLFCDALKKHEGNAVSRVNAPVIITGLPRSGTTYLHRLMIQDERNYGIPLWEMLRPVNAIGKKDQRRLKARIEMAASNFIRGSINHIHYTSYTEPEECVYLFGVTFHALLFWIQFPLHQYAEWYIRQDRQSKYRDYFGYLRILQAEHPGRRLIMKSPEHLGSVQEIRNIIPEARIIEIHRDPITCFSSMNSMLYNLHKSVTHYSDLKKLTSSNMAFLEHEVHRNRSAREHQDLDIIDIRYDDLTNTPVDLVKSIYRKAGMEFNDIHRQKMEAYNLRNPKHKYGRHTYSNSYFGVNNAEMEERLRSNELMP